jgi:hypothetical protein
MSNLCFVFCDHAAGAGTVGDGSALTSDVLAAIAVAINDQLNGEFADEWGGSYNTRIGANDGSDVGEGEIEVAIFQNEDVSGAAGYHDVDPQGRPYIHAALSDASALTTGTFALSQIISHECCETAADPGANRWADRSPSGSLEEALEACDRVEDVSYEKNGISVSNFLRQSAFDPGAPAPWDYQNSLQGQYDTTPGGYAITRQQGVEASAGDKTFSMKTRIAVERAPKATVPTRTPEQQAAYLRRKNHPSSRTRQRGASMAAT